MYRAVGESRSFCAACYNDRYPVPIVAEEPILKFASKKGNG